MREACAEPGSLFLANKCIIPVNALQCEVQKHMTCACFGARALQEAVFVFVCVCPPAQTLAVKRGLWLVWLQGLNRVCIYVQWPRSAHHHGAEAEAGAGAGAAA